MKNEITILQQRPWIKRPLELLFHAEHHFISGDDYGKRLALISFDNSIEVCITTYLTLNPLQREGKIFQRSDVDKRLKNYHTKLDFLFQELHERKLPPLKDRATIVWLHDQRNELYHGKSAGIPEVDTLNAIRQTAMWVFSVLFNVSDVNSLLNSLIVESEKKFPDIPEGFFVPKYEGLSANEEDSFFMATIIGGWSDSVKGDQEVIEEITDAI